MARPQAEPDLPGGGLRLRRFGHAAAISSPEPRWGVPGFAGIHREGGMLRSDDCEWQAGKCRSRELSRRLRHNIALRCSTFSAPWKRHESRVILYASAERGGTSRTAFAMPGTHGLQRVDAIG
jgi:hypothetical protein